MPAGSWLRYPPRGEETDSVRVRTHPGALPCGRRFFGRLCVVHGFHRIADGPRLTRLQYVAISGLREGTYAETKLFCVAELRVEPLLAGLCPMVIVRRPGH